jgi:hypothetical protein
MKLSKLRKPPSSKVATHKPYTFYWRYMFDANSGQVLMGKAAEGCPDTEAQAAAAGYE